jgi:alkaline phosphatase D
MHNFLPTHRESTISDLFFSFQYQGYQSNRNRTLKHLYDNKISNNIFLAGDSHQAWVRNCCSLVRGVDLTRAQVSDLVWRGEKDYDTNTGQGAIGVEFAGTAITSPGSAVGTIAALGTQSQVDVSTNPELQWAEGYYRGYFILTVTPAQVTAQFYGM